MVRGKVPDGIATDAPPAAARPLVVVIAIAIASTLGPPDVVMAVAACPPPAGGRGAPLSTARSRTRRGEGFCAQDPPRKIITLGPCVFPRAANMVSTTSSLKRRP